MEKAYSKEEAIGKMLLNPGLRFRHERWAEWQSVSYEPTHKNARGGKTWKNGFVYYYGPRREDVEALDGAMNREDGPYYECGDPMTLKVDSLEHTIFFEKDSFKVGCQRLTIKDAIKVADFIMGRVK